MPARGAFLDVRIRVRFGQDGQTLDPAQNRKLLDLGFPAKTPRRPQIEHPAGDAGFDALANMNTAQDRVVCVQLDRRAARDSEIARLADLLALRRQSPIERVAR
jgi:hypothetical protein